MNKDLRVNQTTNSNFLINREGQFFICEIIISSGERPIFFDNSVATLKVDKSGFRNIFTLPILSLSSFGSESIRLRFHIQNKPSFFEKLNNFSSQLDKLFLNYASRNSEVNTQDIALSIKSLERQFCEQLKTEIFFRQAKKIHLGVELNYEINNRKKKLVRNLVIDKHVSESKLETEIANFLGKISAEKLFAPEKSSEVGVDEILI